MASTKQSRHEHAGEYDGEPGCHTLHEVNAMFRHYWDPTKYWTCEEQGRPAKLQRCPQSHLYMDSQNQCVMYTEWKWTDPAEPPSRPKSAKST
ncbi:PREDICTED: uncharacterized protein LOC108372455 [Rhagoletis zephyria]|uniref:uncharacterized protein LOC108370227 n=1 Tax=Rhagoletis zephyria TaxID=28612 RepID=UPI0008119909|nr:PREDICTED: uncharacterized protein LOC108370227 [Rhagoletis zephyria]XP_017483636.1 PREDICTED: uncharacterized protein LOC108372455 [Rhagoletis zephyria]XP_036323267.1 uncharacterized protein LOC118737095 [Rhagoletis pomonella]